MVYWVKIVMYVKSYNKNVILLENKNRIEYDLTYHTWQIDEQKSLIRWLRFCIKVKYSKICKY